MVVTVPRPACGRPLPDVVAECLEAGATSIQLRHPTAQGGELFREARQLLPITRRHGAPLIVNDRFDVALAAGADGVHLGPGDLTVEAVRRHTPAKFLIGVSVDDPRAGVAARRAGASYLGIGAVFGTRTKPGLAREAIGTDRLESVLRQAHLPGVGIGGITPANAAEVVATGAGIAVVSTVMGAACPGDAVAQLLAVLESAAGGEARSAGRSPAEGGETRRGPAEG